MFRLTRVSCVAHPTGWYYDQVNVSLTSFYSANARSSVGNYEYSVLATPPIVPQSIWAQVPHTRHDTHTRARNTTHRTQHTTHNVARDTTRADSHGSLRLQYNIPSNTRVTTNVTQCVVEFEQQYYSPSDLTLFFEQMGLPTDTPVTVIGTHSYYFLIISLLFIICNN